MWYIRKLNSVHASASNPICRALLGHNGWSFVRIPHFARPQVPHPRRIRDSMGHHLFRTLSLDLASSLTKSIRREECFSSQLLTEECIVQLVFVFGVMLKCV